MQQCCGKVAAGGGGQLTAFLALQTQSDFLGNLGLLVEDGLGLMMEY
jgi:hypothetical protein